MAKKLLKINRNKLKKNKKYVSKYLGHTGRGYYIADNKNELGGLQAKFIGTSKKDIPRHKKFMREFYGEDLKIIIVK